MLLISSHSFFFIIQLRTHSQQKSTFYTQSPLCSSFSPIWKGHCKYVRIFLSFVILNHTQLKNMINHEGFLHSLPLDTQTHNFNIIQFRYFWCLNFHIYFIMQNSHSLSFNVHSLKRTIILQEATFQIFFKSQADLILNPCKIKIEVAHFKYIMEQYK